MRKAGRRIPWKILINEPGQVGTIRTHSCTYGDQEPYSVAVLNVSDSPIAEGIELLEPQLLMLGNQALILRGYERLYPESLRILRLLGQALATRSTEQIASHFQSSSQKTNFSLINW